MVNNTFAPMLLKTNLDLMIISLSEDCIYLIFSAFISTSKYFQQDTVKSKMDIKT